jgi:hypothetical protein
MDQRKKLLKDELLRQGYRWPHILHRKSLQWLETETRLLAVADRSARGTANAARAEMAAEAARRTFAGY